jgi:lipopolysaccharide transport system permease protein
LIDWNGHRIVVGEIARLLKRHRELIWELTKRDIRDRFVGHVFGVIWAVGHPLFLMALYVFLFAYIFPARFGSAFDVPRDFTLYILAGLIPWLTFQEVLGRSVSVISSNASLVKQIVFPIEVLPIKAVLASSLSQLIATTILLLYALAKGSLSIIVLLLPGLFLVQLLAMIGVCYLLSAVGVFFRDLKDIIQVFCTANLFLQPILYIPGQISSVFAQVFYLNPFSYMVWCYQDAVFYGQIKHPLAWIIFILGSLALFYLSYRLFRRMKISFGNVL